MHTIQLRPPWRVSLPDDTNSDPVGIPTGWPTAVSRLIFARGFNLPTNLGDDRVFLHFRGLGNPARLTFNGIELGDVVSGSRLDITDKLQQANRIEICMTRESETVDESAGITGPVMLEIEAGDAL